MFKTVLIDSHLPPAEEVVDHGLCDGRIVVDHAQSCIASVAEQVSDDAGVMAVVDREMTIGRVGSPFADTAYPALIGEFDVVFGRGDTVCPTEAVVASIFSPPLFNFWFSGLFVLFSVHQLLKTVIDKTHPSTSFAALGDNINLFKASQAPSFLGFGVNSGESMFCVDFASASPTTASSHVLLDGDLPTEGTDSTAIADVYSSQCVEVFPLSLGMPLDVSDGLAFYPPSVLVVSGSSGGLLSTTAMAQAICDSAI